MMDTTKAWMALWQVCLIGTLIIFVAMAVVVSIGGFRDIRKLFRSLDAEDQDDAQVREDT